VRLRHDGKLNDDFLRHQTASSPKLCANDSIATKWRRCAVLIATGMTVHPSILTMSVRAIQNCEGPNRWRNYDATTNYPMRMLIYAHLLVQRTLHWIANPNCVISILAIPPFPVTPVY